MNKVEYLAELEKALRAAHVSEFDDIVEEYSQHFDFKMSDGYGEEEIAAKLASPWAIAAQFRGIGNKSDNEKAKKVFLATGFAFADIAVVSFFVLLYAWVLAFGGLAIASLGLGGALVFGSSLSGLIAGTPFFVKLVFGLSLLAMSVLSALGTVYCYLYTTHLMKVYFRWHKNMLSSSGNVLPPLRKFPLIKPKLRRMMRNVTLYCVLVFAATMVLGYAIAAITAGSFEFWHMWEWFV